MYVITHDLLVLATHSCFAAAQPSTISKEVQSGDLHAGNALTTPPHLHVAVNQNDEMVNPYPILTRAVYVARAQMHVEVGGGLGTR